MTLTSFWHFYPKDGRAKLHFYMARLFLKESPRQEDCKTTRASDLRPQQYNPRGTRDFLYQTANAPGQTAWSRNQTTHPQLQARASSRHRTRQLTDISTESHLYTAYAYQVRRQNYTASCAAAFLKNRRLKNQKNCSNSSLHPLQAQPPTSKEDRRGLTQELFSRHIFF